LAAQIKFEYTARNTPQQNHLAEQGFAHIAKLGRALMNHANIPLKWRFKLFAEAFKTATLLDGLRVVTLNGVIDAQYKHWRGTNPKFIEHLCAWGESWNGQSKRDWNYQNCWSRNSVHDGWLFIQPIIQAIATRCGILPGPRSHLCNEKLYLCTDDIAKPSAVENWLLAQNMCTVLLRSTLASTSTSGTDRGDWD
jgi:hypothetical protein